MLPRRSQTTRTTETTPIVLGQSFHKINTCTPNLDHQNLRDSTCDVTWKYRYYYQPRPSEVERGPWGRGCFAQCKEKPAKQYHMSPQACSLKYYCVIVYKSKPSIYLPFCSVITLGTYRYVSRVITIRSSRVFQWLTNMISDHSSVPKFLSLDATKTLVHVFVISLLPRSSKGSEER